jgi:phage gp29-like protein
MKARPSPATSSLRSAPGRLSPPRRRGLPAVETERRPRNGNGQFLANVAAGGVISPHMSAFVAAWAKRSRFNPIRQLTPDYLSRIMDIFENGYLREFALMAAAIKRRDHMVQVSTRKREKSVSRHSIDVIIDDGLPDDATKARAKEHAAALTWFYDHCKARDVMEQDRVGGKRLLIQQMMEAVYYRYAVHEVVWRPSIGADGRPRLTADFNYVPLYFFEATVGHLRFLRKYFGTIFGEEMPDGQWLVTVADGIAEAIAVCYMYKTMPLKDWVSFSERFGTPGLLGKTMAAYKSQGWVQMMQDLAEFAQHWTAVTNTQNSVELIEPKGSTGHNTIFEPLVEAMNKAIATICRGADLSTISSGHQTQGRGSSLQGDEGNLMEMDDALMITENLAQVDELVIDRMFPGEEPLAHARISVPDQKTVADTIARLTFLISCGVKVGVDYARNELGVPAPGEEEDTLEPPQGALAGGQAKAFGGEDELDQLETQEGRKGEQEGGGLGNALTLRTPALARANARAAGRMAVFRAHALHQLGTAQRAAVRPILEALANVASIEDDVARHAALTKLHAQIVGPLGRRVLADPAIAHAIEEIYGTVLVSAAAEAAARRAQAQEAAPAT